MHGKHFYYCVSVTLLNVGRIATWTKIIVLLQVILNVSELMYSCYIIMVGSVAAQQYIRTTLLVNTYSLWCGSANCLVVDSVHEGPFLLPPLENCPQSVVWITIHTT